MTRPTVFDCTTDQSRRPDAIEFLMELRRKLAREDKSLRIERTSNADGTVVTVITEGAVAKPAEEAPQEVEEAPEEAAEESAEAEKPVRRTRRKS